MKPMLTRDQIGELVKRRALFPNAPRCKGQYSCKRPYARPKAIFVPLKLEERLLACGKQPSDPPPCTRGGTALPLWS